MSRDLYTPLGRDYNRALSPAEEEGWRRYWDGYIICPKCKEAKIKANIKYYKSHNLNYYSQWPVPADYDTPIGEAHETFHRVSSAALYPHSS
jgi:hypothetical protein